MSEIGVATGGVPAPAAPARYELREVGVYDREAGELVLPTDPAWRTYEAARAAGEVPDPMPVRVVEESFDQALADKIARVENIAAEVRFSVVGNASAAEMASWTLKYQQALAFQRGDPPDSYAMLALEGEARGVTTAEIASRVLANAAAYSQAEAEIAGVAGRHKDALRRFTTTAEVLSYDISQGWPGRAAAPVFQPPPTPVSPPP